MGVREQVLGSRNWMQKVVEFVPGFRGYYTKEHRRDADRLMREAVALRLKGAADALGELSAGLVRAKRLEEVERCQRLSQRLAAAGDRVRTAASGYAGFFDTVKVREAEIDRLYELDAALLAEAEAARGIAGKGEAALPDLETKAAAIERALDRRRETMTRLSD